MTHVYASHCDPRENESNKEEPEVPLGASGEEAAALWVEIMFGSPIDVRASGPDEGIFGYSHFSSDEATN